MGDKQEPDWVGFAMAMAALILFCGYGIYRDRKIDAEFRERQRFRPTRVVHNRTADGRPFFYFQ